MPSGPSFREHRAFERFARDLVRLPDPGENPLEYLLPEARWRELTGRAPDAAAWLMALSQATGVYFFPSREWVLRLRRYLRLLRVTRVLEAGAGRGYLTAALAPACAAAGIRFRAVDTGDGEFVSGLPVYAGVERADALYCGPGVCARRWCSMPGRRRDNRWPPFAKRIFCIILFSLGKRPAAPPGPGRIGRPCPTRFPRPCPRYGRGRTGALSRRVTVFYGGGQRSRSRRRF